MDRLSLIEILKDKFKLIRIENSYTQDEMANLLGISKKTLVQIEKGRVLPGWTTTVALCALFRHSEVLQNTIGGDPLELLSVIAHSVDLIPQEHTLGGKIWWVDIQEEGKFRIQQNIISRHYRILDEQNQRWTSSFDLEQIQFQLKKLLEKERN